jgi:hypothetical protein
VGPRAGLDTEVRGKILCPCRGSNLDRGNVQYSLVKIMYRNMPLNCVLILLICNIWKPLYRVILRPNTSLKEVAEEIIWNR